MSKLSDNLQNDKNELLNRIDSCAEMLNVQGRDGNWNYDDYMLGMYNGMEYMMSILENRQPNYRKAPDVWLKYKPILMKKTFESEDEE